MSTSTKRKNTLEVGLGIALQDIREHLDAEKLYSLLSEEEQMVLQMSGWADMTNAERLTELEESIASNHSLVEIVQRADQRFALISDTDGHSKHYLLYTRRYGWEYNDGLTTEAQARNYIADLIASVSQNSNRKRFLPLIAVKDTALA